MGVNESKTQTTKDLDKYITYLRNTKIDYLQPKNKPLDSGKCQLGPLVKIIEKFLYIPLKKKKTLDHYILEKNNFNLALK